MVWGAELSVPEGETICGVNTPLDKENFEIVREGYQTTQCIIGT